MYVKAIVCWLKLHLHSFVKKIDTKQFPQITSEIYLSTHETTLSPKLHFKKKSNKLKLTLIFTEILHFQSSLQFCELIWINIYLTKVIRTSKRVSNFSDNYSN